MWEKSSALAKLKAKFPDDESRHRLNRKSRIDDTPLEKPIELPKKSEKPKGKKGTKVPLDDDAPTTHMVAAAEAAADNTMYRDCVITTHASNCRVVKVLFDSGSTPFNFVREVIADWIEAEELKGVKYIIIFKYQLRRTGRHQLILDIYCMYILDSSQNHHFKRFCSSYSMFCATKGW